MPDQLLRDRLGKDLDAQGLFWRAATIAPDATDAREFTGIGVPWGQQIEHWFGVECFDEGAVEAAADAKILYQHRDTIGRVIATADTEQGCQITGRISDTTLGRDVWTLVRDGVIDSLSIGFEPLEYRVDEDDVLHWTRVRAAEFSLVTFPAYDQALLDPDTLRQAKPAERTTTMPETLTIKDLDPINDALDDLQRHVKRIDANTTTSSTAGMQWRSMGDFLKAIVGGDQDAAEFHRAYTGATTADTVMEDTFVGEYIKLVNDHRKLVADFTTGVLPDKGTSIDYAQLDEDTTQVAKQANEGDDLLYGKVSLKKANAPVETVGGWTEMSLQSIKRATVPSLNTTLRALGLKYARYSNLAVVKALTDQIAAHIAADATDDNAALDLAANATVDNWLDLIVDAALTMEERGFELKQAHASVDVFKELIRLKDGDTRLMTVYGQGVNQVGRLDLRAVSGDLAGVTVKLLPDRSKTDIFAFSDPVAIEFLESPGAPAQLQDENIINLTKQFSIYGFQSVLVPFPGAILPVQFGV